MGALAALLPDNALNDDLEPDLLIAHVTDCIRPNTGGTTWVTTGLIGGAIFHVLVEAADGWWAWDHHRDDQMEIESLTAWIRPLRSLSSISLVSARLATPRDRDFIPHAKWSLNFGADAVEVPHSSTLEAQGRLHAWNLIEAIREARFTD
ncbi:hypothetical protein GCM10009721_07850 [Terrabacter tumescens]|uniref:Uncharacterized protein n=1 Tax=Terrabacter tumescens TaxID=60443 RepID=A0ABQ2HNH5_9MICO|nr:hypothetical protein [Terrabacter tumescens]GGM85582.1 hypothetical protein GCM10009721_07850 [Terrabacter tumescens]